jgi:hypothetical protein
MNQKSYPRMFSLARPSLLTPTTHTWITLTMALTMNLTSKSQVHVHYSTPHTLPCTLSNLRCNICYFFTWYNPLSILSSLFLLFLGACLFLLIPCASLGIDGVSFSPKPSPLFYPIFRKSAASATASLRSPPTTPPFGTSAAGLLDPRAGLSDSRLTSHSANLPVCNPTPDPTS